ncbi:MAG: oligoendopeptidase F, partial [Clostridia bacterium]|nr:oligoendopeptidase F [Clostridia bacterium]
MALDRNQVPAERKWRVEDIFENVEAWNALYAECEGELDFSEFEGKLNTVESVLACMEKMNALILKLNKLAVYAHMRHDEDSRNSEFTALSARFSMLGMKVSG